jgi:DNA polymerase/3'-5' exonuclease PolX
MSKSALRLPLARATNLAERIAGELLAVCDRLEIAGSIRRRRPDVGDIELVVIPRYAATLIPDVPGVSLLELELNTWVLQGRLLSAGPNKGAALKKYFIPSLDYTFKLEINISSPDRWPVELAIKTGSAEFSHRLVTPRNKKTSTGAYGLLPSHCRIGDGWQVWEGRERRGFAEEREFIEWVCGKWIEPQDRH